MFRKKPKSDPDPPSARDATLVALRPWIEAQRRPAWRPLVELGEPEAGRSKFCGSPHLMPGEDVPVCKFCGRELQLLVQVDLDRVPGDLHGSGVLQLFYCVGRDPGGTDDGHVECWAEGAWQPFSDEASLVRVVPHADLHVHGAGRSGRVVVVELVDGCFDDFDQFGFAGEERSFVVGEFSVPVPGDGHR